MENAKGAFLAVCLFFLIISSIILIRVSTLDDTKEETTGSVIASGKTPAAIVSASIANDQPVDTITIEQRIDLFFDSLRTAIYRYNIPAIVLYTIVAAVILTTVIVLVQQKDKFASPLEHDAELEQPEPEATEEPPSALATFFWRLAALSGALALVLIICGSLTILLRGSGYLNVVFEKLANRLLRALFWMLIVTGGVFMVSLLVFLLASGRYLYGAMGSAGVMGAAGGAAAIYHFFIDPIFRTGQEMEDKGGGCKEPATDKADVGSPEREAMRIPEEQVKIEPKDEAQQLLDV